MHNIVIGNRRFQSIHRQKYLHAGSTDKRPFENAKRFRGQVHLNILTINVLPRFESRNRIDSIKQVLKLEKRTNPAVHVLN